MSCCPMRLRWTACSSDWGAAQRPSADAVTVPVAHCKACFGDATAERTDSHDVALGSLDLRASAPMPALLSTASCLLHVSLASLCNPANSALSAACPEAGLGTFGIEMALSSSTFTSASLQVGLAGAGPHGPAERAASGSRAGSGGADHGTCSGRRSVSSSASCAATRWWRPQIQQDMPLAADLPDDSRVLRVGG